jgi:uncharacterized membrane protein YoaK (UPF0700 family)
VQPTSTISKSNRPSTAGSCTRGNPSSLSEASARGQQTARDQTVEIGVGHVFVASGLAVGATGGTVIEFFRNEAGEACMWAMRPDGTDTARWFDGELF